MTLKTHRPGIGSAQLRDKEEGSQLYAWVKRHSYEYKVKKISFAAHEFKVLCAFLGKQPINGKIWVDGVIEVSLWEQK